MVGKKISLFIIMILLGGCCSSPFQVTWQMLPQKQKNDDSRDVDGKASLQSDFSQQSKDQHDEGKLETHIVIVNISSKPQPINKIVVNKEDCCNRDNQICNSNGFPLAGIDRVLHQGEVLVRKIEDENWKCRIPVSVIIESGTCTFNKKISTIFSSLPDKWETQCNIPIEPKSVSP